MGKRTIGSDDTEGVNANDIALQDKLVGEMEMEKLEGNHIDDDNMADRIRDNADSKMVVVENEEEVDPNERETWGKKIDFLLSVIGFAVDLANVWRFPYLCYKNGGGAFLIPYCLMLFCGGIPLFYMELALGQFNRKGAITCWGRICPLFKGIGYAVVLIAFYTDFYYNIIIAWSLHFFFASFTSELPWTRCGHEWNTENCYDGHLHGESTALAGNASGNTTVQYQVVTTLGPVITNITTEIVKNASNISIADRVSPAVEYYNRGMLGIHRSGGVGDLGIIKWDMILCVLAVYIICYFSLWKGISTSGKVVWFTAVFPYIVLFILLIRGVTLPGAMKGIQYYLTPNFERLKTSEVWVDAAQQVFFSLGPGFGVLLAFSSYNKFHNNVYADALATSTINCMTSFLSGFVIFSVLGYMSEKSGKDIGSVATEGPGLVFVVYPEAISTLPAPTFWAIIFFMMLLTLGLDSSFGGSEAIITALSDEFPILKRKREWFVAGLFTLYFVVGLASCTEGGAYIVTLLDKYAAGYSILFAVFFEALAVSWFYGVTRFSDDIEEMLGFRPGIYWRICWKYIAPVFLSFIIAFGLVKYQPLTYEDYVYPTWANVMGWGVALSSILCIPGMAAWQIHKAPGYDIWERMRYVTTPWRCRQKSNIVANANMVTVNGDHPVESV